MSAIDRKISGNGGSRPRYQLLAEDLRNAILRGDFPDPAQFPTESVLCARYGVSRFTVREALRALQNEGLIRRRRGSGTVVQPAAARSALQQPFASLDEMLQYARDTQYGFEAAGAVALPKRLAAHIGVSPAGRWHHFRGVRTRPGQPEPIAYTEAWVHPDLAAVARTIRPGQATIFAQLETGAGIRIARVTQEIQAVSASLPVATALGIARRSPCLRIVRGFHDRDDRVVEIAVSHHPGDRFGYTMHIEVEG